MKFLAFRNREGKWRWQLESSNGRVIAASVGDGYASLKACLKSIDQVKECAGASVRVIE